MSNVTRHTFLEPASAGHGENPWLHAKAFIASYGSAETRKAYTHDLGLWFDWCNRHELHPYYGVKRAQVELFMRHLEGRGLANATRARKIAALNAWMWWLIDEELIEANPAHRVHRPRKQKGRRPALTRSEATDLIVAAEAHGPDEAALIKLMVLQGLRVGTVVRINVQDVTNDRWQPVVTVISKGDKMVSTPLVPRTMASVEAAIGDRTRGPLLRNESGNRMTYSNVRYRMRLLCEAADIPVVPPHALRRTFARIAHDEGADLHTIQRAMHHEDPKTTTVYLSDEASPYEHPSFSVMTATAR